MLGCTFKWRPRFLRWHVTHNTGAKEEDTWPYYTHKYIYMCIYIYYMHVYMYSHTVGCQVWIIKCQRVWVAPGMEHDMINVRDRIWWLSTQSYIVKILIGLITGAIPMTIGLWLALSHIISQFHGTVPYYISMNWELLQDITNNRFAHQLRWLRIARTTAPVPLPPMRTHRGAVEKRVKLHR